MATTAATSAPTRLGGRTWTSLVILGLVGQLAWAVENMYLNLFVYDTITDDPTAIAVMVAASAITATLATFLVGAASDRLRKRRIFIAGGYVLWGLSTAAFGFVSVDGIATIAAAGNAVVITVVAVILLDCIMSLFGSGANDAAFNAWVTESTVPSNRGRVEGVLSVMPLLAMLIVFGGFDGLTQAGQWREFFIIIGLLTTSVGVLAWFLVKDAPTMQAQTDGYLKAVLHGLRPSVMRATPQLYVTLAVLAVVSIGAQVFMPYLIIYIQRYLRIDGYAIVLGSVLLSAAILSVIGGRVIDRVGKVQFMTPAILIFAAGLAAMFFVRGMVPVILAGIVMITGLMLTLASTSATIRDYTPADRVGNVQGLRMIAAVLIPMIIGPFIGSSVIIGANETYLDLGVEKQVPTPWIFVAAAIVVLLALIPVRKLAKS
ncbi:MFS transporter [Salinibacterium hongtaonis]|uniref:MFS transporter n=1 Tax=Homoserinimonas hongtaonis TaxID=2079791 RepID=A0A2U1T226_9MICO|nr:MFS transporter [Salinibacterium hongtaonis]PWB97917.1 MFS transporter [Salinibacterium hongtaonis]